MTQQAPSRPGRPAHMAPPERFDPELERTILVTKAVWLFDWSRKSALWPLGFGLATAFVVQRREFRQPCHCRLGLSLPRIAIGPLIVVAANEQLGRCDRYR